MLWVALMALLGCGEPRSERPNVVVILIDTLRADSLPFYGYEKDTAPFLSELAAKSALFENAYSTSSWTAPAMASLFTSLYPRQHGVLTGFTATGKMQEIDPTITVNRIPEELETLPEMMRAAGYRTYGVADNFNISELLGFRDGFDRFKMHYFKGAKFVNRDLIRWSRDIRDDPPYFVYAHYTDPHAPYLSHAPDGSTKAKTPEEKRANYDQEIRHVDAKIRELFEHFGWGPQTFVIVVSDHGEEFWDHGHVGHTRTLYEEVVRVPFLVHGPGIEPARISEPASIIDLVPTLRALLELPPNEVEQGVALFQAGDAELERPLFGHVRRVLRDGGRTHRSALSGSWKYIHSTGAEETHELFDLAADPGESNNLVDEHPERARGLQTLLDDYEQNSRSFYATDVHTTLDDEERERLRALGYVD